MSLPEPLPATHPQLARATGIIIGALLLGFFLAFERFLAGSWRLVAAAFAAVGFYLLVGGGALWLLQRTVGPRRWLPLVLVSAAIDPRFKDPGSPRPGIAMAGRTWPHGFTGTAVPHGTVFSR